MMADDVLAVVECYAGHRGEDAAGDLFIVRHDEMSGQWELTLFERWGRDDDTDVP